MEYLPTSTPKMHQMYLKYSIHGAGYGMILRVSGFYVSCTEAANGGGSSDEEGLPGLVDVAWRLEEMPKPPEEGQPCHECGQRSEEGQRLGCECELLMFAVHRSICIHTGCKHVYNII